MMKHVICYLVSNYFHISSQRLRCMYCTCINSKIGLTIHKGMCFTSLIYFITQNILTKKVKHNIIMVVIECTRLVRII